MPPKDNLTADDVPRVLMALRVSLMARRAHIADREKQITAQIPDHQVRNYEQIKAEATGALDALWWVLQLVEQELDDIARDRHDGTVWTVDLAGGQL